jgi:hypothetical protein
MPVREHAARCLLGNQKTPKRADGDSLRNIGGGQIYKYTSARASADLRRILAREN